MLISLSPRRKNLIIVFYCFETFEFPSMMDSYLSFPLKQPFFRLSRDDFIRGSFGSNLFIAPLFNSNETIINHSLETCLDIHQTSIRHLHLLLRHPLSFPEDFWDRVASFDGLQMSRAVMRVGNDRGTHGNS